MIKILFIVTEYNSANGICVQSIINASPEKDYYFYVVTNNERKEISTSRKNVEIIKVKPRLSYRLRDVANSSSGAKRKIYAILFNIVNKLSLGKAVFTWPLISMAYSNRIYKSALKIVKNSNVDYIVPIYTQIDALIAANRIKESHRGIKYIPYLLDAFASGYGPKIFSQIRIEKRCLKWEERLFCNADGIISMISTKAFYEQKKQTISYFNKIKFLDIPLFNFSKSCTGIEHYKNDGLINLVYVGSLPLKIRNPKYIIDCFKRLEIQMLRLLFVGSCDNESELNRLISSDQRIIRIPYVEHSKAIEIMNEADVLINIGNNIPSMVPSKIFEYISLGKPIISTSSIPDDSSNIYLSKYPLSLIVNEKDSLDQSMQAIISFLNSIKYKNKCMSDFSESFSLNKPETFLKCLNNF